MTILFEFKEMIKEFYQSYERYIVTGGKLILYLVLFIMLNNKISEELTLISGIIIIVLSIINTFIPPNWAVLTIIAFISGRIGYISLEASILITAILLILYLLCVRVFKNMAYFAYLTPLLFALRLGYAVPVVAGLFFGPVALAPMCAGAFAFKLSKYLPDLLKMRAQNIYDMPEATILMYKYIANTMLSDTGILITVIVMAATLAITYFISRRNMPYIWYIAIAAGTAIQILAFIIGVILLKAEISMLSVVLGSIAGGAFAVVGQFLRFSLDYPRTEKVQFEDETYYYYVKAIPKVKLSKTEKAITKIK